MIFVAGVYTIYVRKYSVEQQSITLNNNSYYTLFRTKEQGVFNTIEDQIWDNFFEFRPMDWVKRKRDENYLILLH